MGGSKLLQRLLLLLPFLDSFYTANAYLIPGRRRTAALPLLYSTADPGSDGGVGSNTDARMPMKPGSTVALITPFSVDTGNIDYQGLRQLLRYHVEAGTDNLCILGTTGEASSMTMEERQQVLQIAVEEVKGVMPILVGTGTINPDNVKAQTLQAMDLGCDAALVVTPYYVKPPQRCLVQHMVTTADLGLPVVIYNVPGRTGVNFLDENIAIASQHENVVGLKDATGDLTRVEQVRPLVGDDFLLYSGDDGTSLEYLRRGGDGFISVTANIAAAAMKDLVTAVREQRMDDADAINRRLDILHQKLFLESNPIPTKWAAAKLGLVDSAYCRRPLAEFDSALHAELEQALQDAGML